ncbi:MAG: class I SAM-dependent methyltransferase [Bowdeniella nasicola]|nr:class I SAM-dependent methyltransferase [Bowdeniella nasicola]
MHHRPIPHLPNPHRQLRVPAAGGDSFGQRAGEYRQVRPDYPDAILSAVCSHRPHTAVDIGAGTGIFTAQLQSHVNEVIAVEPDADLAAELAKRGIRVARATGERTGLTASCADLVSYAQAWHWVEPTYASMEAARILRPDGILALVWNQLDVSRPWVHRLARIMRSGDVHPTRVAPQVAGPFELLGRELVHFTQQLSTPEVLALARTRSSYLQADAATGQRMQANLLWYLREHLRFAPDQPIGLPYLAVAWRYRREH